MNELRIARCGQCGKIQILHQKADMPGDCCGKTPEILQMHIDGEMEETHAPVITRKDGHLYAYVGAYDHLMAPDHYIEWILLVSSQGERLCLLKPGDEPKAIFLPGEQVIAVYAYCSRHGLWKTEI